MKVTNFQKLSCKHITKVAIFCNVYPSNQDLKLSICIVESIRNATHKLHTVVVEIVLLSHAILDLKLPICIHCELGKWPQVLYIIS